MDQHNKFLFIETAVALFLLGITFIEIFDPVRFQNIVFKLMDSTSWFLGLTFGAVTTGVLKGVKSAADSVLKATSRFEGKFIYFLTSLAIFALIAAIASRFALWFLKDYFEFFHLIFVQWFVVVYIWFKVSGKYELQAKYVITTELIVLACSLLVLWQVF
ncbi:hypothetical protein HZA33_02145, partial [Candidatus Pacearchaeota archaeon]|nr:hypothetical protein [Candidatus Pacearchaeota archaeon]